MKTKFLAFFIVLVTVFFSCENKMDEYYETPDWLKGNAWQVLESKGNFKLFLEAVDKTSKDLKFKDLVQGKGIITVMAPTDEAFQAYLTANGYSSISDIPTATLDKLVGYHLLYYSFSPSDLMDYKPGGAGTINKYPGIYFKYRTKSTDGVIEMTDVANGGIVRNVIRKERFLPVFSTSYFNTFELDAKTDYEYFYPNSTWNNSNSFNVSNANVISASDNMIALITDNGYAYMLNQVLEPLETIYNQVKNEANYSSFITAYDRFVEFKYDEASTLEYSGTDSLFVQYHNGLFPIGSEWTTGYATPNSSDYAEIEKLSSLAYTLLAPSNTAMQSFFNKYWASYYSSLDDVNFEPLRYLLMNHIAESLLFPTQLESGKFTTYLGSDININRSEPEFKKIAVNGAVYGLKTVYTPSLFDKVTAPMFCDPKYDYFLNMMVYTSTISTLTSDMVQYKVFYPSNDMIVQNTLIEGRAISYENRNPKKYGEQYLLVESDDGLPINMSSSRRISLANSHVAIDQLSVKGDEAIYRTPSSYNYIYVKGDKVYSSGLFNLSGGAALDNIPTAVKINGSWTNGEAYALTGASASALSPEYRQFKNVASLPIGYPAEWEWFKYLISAAGFTTQNPSFPFIQGERFIVLMPKNEVLLPKLGTQVPLYPADKVASFLKPYFIKVNDSNLFDYPFSGSGVSKELVSFGVNSSGQVVKFKLSDNGTNLYVEDAKGNKIKVDTYFPQIYSDCAVYMIDGLLEIE